MAIQHADNFSIYGTNTALMTNGIYAEATSVTLIPDPDGISAGYVLNAQTEFTTGVRFVLNDLETTVGMAARLWMPALPSDGNHTPSMVFSDVNNTTVFATGIDTTGRIRVFLGNPTGGGNPATPVATTAAPVVGANAWWHIETKLTTSAGLLTWEIRVEGLTVMTGSVQQTNTNELAQVVLGASCFTPKPYYWKDFVVWDGSGSQNNDFLGSVLVTNLTPVADVSLNWTPSTGTTGYQILDNDPPVDTEFISAPYPNIPAAYKGSLGPLPPTTTSVKALITRVRAAKADGGDGSLQNGIVSAGVTSLGANRPITVAQTYWSDIFELDPATSNPWLPASVNAVNYTINRTT